VKIVNHPFIWIKKEMPVADTRCVKVKKTVTGKITVVYQVKRTDREDWDEFSVSSWDDATISFTGALNGLVVDVLEILELPKAYSGSLRLSGVSFSYAGEEGTMGAVITGIKTVSTAHAPFVMNTPYLPSKDLSDEGGQPVLSERQVEHLEVMAAEALDYAKGKRKQMEFPLQGVGNEIDALASEALPILEETQRAAASVLSRRLKISTTNASRVLDLLEEKGIVGPPRKGKPREILADLKKGDKLLSA